MSSSSPDARTEDAPPIEHSQRKAPSRGVLRPVIGVALVAGIGALWAWGPLNDFATPQAVVEATRPFVDHWWASPVAVVGFALAALVFAPMTLLILVLVLLFGPWHAFGVAWMGSMLSAALGHTVGRFFWRQAIGGRFLERRKFVARALGENQIRSTIILRLIPIAPFTLVNFVAGSVRISLRSFLVGSLIGAVPMLALLTFASDQVVVAIREPSGQSVGAAAAVVIALGVLAWFARRLAAGQTRSN